MHKSPHPPTVSRVAGLPSQLTTNNRSKCLYTAGALILAAVSIFAADPSESSQIRVVEIQGAVHIMAHSNSAWHVARTNELLHPFDRLRTGPNSRAAVQWSNQSVVSFGAQTELEVLEPDAKDSDNGLHLLRGVTSFFHRDKPGRLRVITRGATAGVEGTEFVMAVNETDQSTISVIDGRVRFGNQKATVVLTNGEQASVEFGKAPVRGTGFVANNILQWALYYPTVLDTSDLNFSVQEHKTFADSLAEYRRGDVLAALAKTPSQAPASDNARVYRSALLLAVGDVNEAEKELRLVRKADARATALRTLMAAVKRQAILEMGEPKLTSELLARSYYEQSRAIPEVSLTRALELAKRAVKQSPQSGFAWSRMAELEFSFGRLSKAEAALDKSFEFAPRNSAALSLQGIILLAENNPREAIDWFDRAIAADAALANGWLGRGLCEIRIHDDKGGEEDLLIAAALEPQRAELRSYLGKAYATVKDYPRAENELCLAKKLDPNDPTAWLYSALVKRNENRVNEAVRDLETSAALNNNRSVFRSQLMLDRDQAVRSANLANIYRDAGMTDVSVNEASKAVSYDYGNYSAHLFLADSYNDLVGPNHTFFRSETALLSEYRVANLLAPASAGWLTPAMTLEENSKFFERDRLGISSETTYLSRGAWQQDGEQYGISGDLSYDLHATYQCDPGEHVDRDIEERSLELSLKQQFTPKDSAFLQVANLERETGYTSQTYIFPAFVQPYRTHETQEPVVTVGFHHEWSPGVHTLFFTQRIDDTTSISARYLPTFDVFRGNFPPDRTITGIHQLFMQELYTNKTALYSAELQQIWQTPNHNTVAGARAQTAASDTRNNQDLPDIDGAVFNTPAVVQDLHSRFSRLTFYAYHNWNIIDSFQLAGGVAYDRLRFPENTQISPISNREREADQVSPKAGFIWTPLKLTTMRFAYTRALGDSSLGQSTQIEPSQVAGFQQAFRSIIPDSVGGETPAARFETFNLSIEQKFPTGTYLAVYGTILNSQVRRSVGDFEVLSSEPWAIPSQQPDKLAYNEKNIQFNVNQLVGDFWSFGAQYRASDATLNDNFYELPDHVQFGGFPARSRRKALLHQVRLSGFFNHPNGFFTKGEAIWNKQDNFSADMPGDDFWQFNIYAGYRFFHRKAEATLAVLNITNEDYRLNPLNIYEEFPQRRTLMARLRFNF